MKAYEISVQHLLCSSSWYINKSNVYYSVKETTFEDLETDWLMWMENYQLGLFSGILRVGGRWLADASRASFISVLSGWRRAYASKKGCACRVPAIKLWSEAGSSLMPSLVHADGWNTFNFPVFVLRFNKFSSNLTFCLVLWAVFSFLVLRQILQLNKQKQIFSRPFFKSARILMRIMFSSVRSFIISEPSSFVLLMERTIFFTVKFCRSCSWLATLRISTNFILYDFRG